MKQFRNKLVVSCQDNPDWTIQMALKGGAGGLRVNEPSGVKLVLSKDSAIPIVACWKHDIVGLPIRITPTINDALGLVTAGATYAAFDATNRRRLHSVLAMVSAIHKAGAGAVADVMSEDEALDAMEDGADIVSTTLFPKQDYGIITRMANAGMRVMAEGNIRTPEEAKRCADAGAELVCVGSAIT